MAPESLCAPLDLEVASRLPGSAPVSTEVRALIRKMSRENPLWGAPRIHGELLELGIDVGETSVGKYMVRRPKPPDRRTRVECQQESKKSSGLG